MSLLSRFLGIETSETEAGSESPGLARIVASLEGMPRDRAHYLASFACVLARVAHADLRIEDSEIGAMQRATASLGNLEDDEARLVVEIASTQTREDGGTTNFQISRKMREISTREQRFGLVECLYAVAAADGSISTTESAEVLTIAQELGLSRNETNALKAGWKDHLAEFQGLAAK